MIYVWKNFLILGILNDSLVYFAGKSITNTNNSRIFSKMKNYFLACQLGPGEVWWKKQRQKSRDTVPLNLLSVNNYWQLWTVLYYPIFLLWKFYKNFVLIRFSEQRMVLYYPIFFIVESITKFRETI
jgi:hypothetical protein